MHHQYSRRAVAMVQKHLKGTKLEAERIKARSRGLVQCTFEIQVSQEAGQQMKEQATLISQIEVGLN